MRGFAPRWRDVPDFINGITNEIWEGRQIGALRDLYAPGLIVRSPASVLTDNSQVIGATLATLSEFPDRQLLGEDVIWCDDAARSDSDHSAYLSSHRLYCTATHTGDGVYGPASGTTFRYRILADCAIRQGRVEDEWLVRDQSAIVRQMGLTPEAFARILITAEGGPANCVPPMTPANDHLGPYTGTGNTNPHGAQLADILTRMLTADFSVIPQTYDRAATLHYPGNITTHGHAAADQFWLSLRAAFPSAKFQIHHQIGRADPMLPPRAALRWSLHGPHDGPGPFGPATGADVYIMGITHAEFGPRGLRAEWTLIDVTAIWKQILLHQS